MTLNLDSIDTDSEPDEQLEAENDNLEPQNNHHSKYFHNLNSSDEENTTVVSSSTGVAEPDQYTTSSSSMLSSASSSSESECENVLTAPSIVLFGGKKELEKQEKLKLAMTKSNRYIPRGTCVRKIEVVYNCSYQYKDDDSDSTTCTTSKCFGDILKLSDSNDTLTSLKPYLGSMVSHLQEEQILQMVIMIGMDIYRKTMKSQDQTQTLKLPQSVQNILAKESSNDHLDNIALILRNRIELSSGTKLALLRSESDDSESDNTVTSSSSDSEFGYLFSSIKVALTLVKRCAALTRVPGRRWLEMGPPELEVSDEKEDNDENETEKGTVTETEQQEKTSSQESDAAACEKDKNTKSESSKTQNDNFKSIRPQLLLADLDSQLLAKPLLSDDENLTELSESAESIQDWQSQPLRLISDQYDSGSDPYQTDQYEFANCFIAETAYLFPRSSSESFGEAGTQKDYQAQQDESMNFLHICVLKDVRQTTESQSSSYYADSAEPFFDLTLDLRPFVDQYKSLSCCIKDSQSRDSDNDSTRIRLTRCFMHQKTDDLKQVTKSNSGKENTTVSNSQQECYAKINTVFTTESGTTEESQTLTELVSFDPQGNSTHTVSNSDEAKFLSSCLTAEKSQQDLIDSFSDKMLDPVCPLISKYHYLVFSANWNFFHGMQLYNRNWELFDSDLLQDVIEDKLVGGIEKVMSKLLVNDVKIDTSDSTVVTHPILIRFYSLIAKIASSEGKLSKQQRYLEKEHELVSCFFPKECDLLERLLTKLLQ